MIKLAVFIGLWAMFAAGYWLRGWVDRQHGPSLPPEYFVDGLKDHVRRMSEGNEA